MEGECDKGFAEYIRKSSPPPPFLVKTFMLVEDKSSDEVISWNVDGTGFVVWQPAEFARDLLPTLFKHSNFSSFVRQLNTYGFRKVATRRWEFCNDMFRKGGKELLCEIRRRKSWATKPQPAKRITKECVEDQRSSSISSSSDITSLVDQNKRLKKEHGVLCSELSNMKKKCKELLDLVAMHAIDADRDEMDERPMLFGVRLEVEGERDRKRQREEISKSINVLLSQSCK